MPLSPYASVSYQKHCLTEPVFPALLWGGILTALDGAQHGTMRSITPKSAGVYIGAIYIYNAVQCPMEAVHGRRSLLHNVLSAGTLGYLGVSAGKLGVPFIDPHTLYYRYPQLSPPTLAFLVYGAMGGLLASLGGKPL